MSSLTISIPALHRCLNRQKHHRLKDGEEYAGGDTLLASSDSTYLPVKCYKGTQLKSKSHIYAEYYDSVSPSLWRSLRRHRPILIFRSVEIVLKYGKKILTEGFSHPKTSLPMALILIFRCLNSQTLAGGFVMRSWFDVPEMPIKANLQLDILTLREFVPHLHLALFSQILMHLGYVN
ncbi:hypothetical protein L1887_16859 [Cichorium endivia]|nr:hypothetical protein L1887_16859 [Cichorium endivia]